MAASIAIHLEFGGGAELLFNGVKKHHVTLPSQSEPWDMKQLLVWIQRNLLKERPELFVQGDSVRPGILVLINDADWELMCVNVSYNQEEAAGKDCPWGLLSELIFT
ncbi:ubiquitin-related modifier 1 isoform X1 [Haplochromis burtoni]|uniref:ubiquitin-related modifier 1 isoform X1 n=1 Tax=Haplochromis burtoni TaxID=8153 RepID=UPI0006C9A891|nr:ubiquitin-related modifier 1 isoform X1 [Haplochromis burtoni]